MQELKKIGVLSSVKVMSLFGLIAGLIMSLYMWALYKFTPTDVLSSMGVNGLSFTFGTALTIIFFQVVVYSLLALIGALLYNLFSSWIGGIKFDLIEIKSVKKTSKKKK